MPKTKDPYTCPRCGYETLLKADMRKHLYDLKRPCPGQRSKIVLTDDVKQEILDSRIYYDNSANINITNINIRNGKTPKNSRRKQLPKHICTLVWNKYVGEDTVHTTCFCCNVTSIRITSFDCGHVIACANGGKDTIDNLRPICRQCNLSMGTRDMREFMETHGLNGRSEFSSSTSTTPVDS